MDDQTNLGTQHDAGEGTEPGGGPADGQAMPGDANADGVTDYVTIAGSDGSTLTAFDNDQSGTFEEVRIDSDGDWVADVTAFDTNADGQFDVVQTVDPATGQLVTTGLPGTGVQDPIQMPVQDPVTQDPTPSAPGTPGWYDEQGLPQPGYDVNPNPEITSDPAPQPVVDNEYGDGAGEIQYAQDQALPGYCGPASIAMILTEVLGRPIDDVAVANDVNNAGLLIFNESGGVVGMTSTAIVTMFDAYGIEAHVENGTMQTLSTYLEADRDIILAVDSSEVWGWAEQGVDVSDGTGVATADKSDHFLVITEINYDTGMATINDPGMGEAYGFAAGTGHGYQIPISLLDDAWADSGRHMVVTDPIPVTAGGAELGAAAATGPDTSAASALDAFHPGLVLLPVEVGRRVAQAIRAQRHS